MGEGSARLDAIRQTRLAELRDVGPGLDIIMDDSDAGLLRLSEPGDALRQTLGVRELRKRKRDADAEAFSPSSPSPPRISPAVNDSGSEEYQALKNQWLKEDFLSSIDSARARAIQKVFTGENSKSAQSHTPEDLKPFIQLVRNLGIVNEADHDEGESESAVTFFNLPALLKTTK